ncbi:MAG: rRNA maturation RNase YbeY [Gallionella sp.]
MSKPTPQKAEKKLSLSVQYASNASDLPTRAQFRRWFKAALLGDVSLTLRIVDAEEGRTLNKSYRGKDYATNVLTFVYEDDPVSGDVVICAPVVAKEANEQNKNLLAHYAHMSIHSALHLQGYDHEVESEAEEMEALETSIMLKLRYANPYQS